MPNELSGTNAASGGPTDETTVLSVFVNGKEVRVTNPDPEWTLLQFLREHQGLTGTKLGCGEGGCGACTVMVSHFSQTHKKIIHRSANACLTPACSVDGMAVTTLEAIGSTKTRLHPVQERLAEAHGSQCGFCTPGIVMSMYVLLRNNPSPTLEEIEENFDGNLCRCTGYRPILAAYHTFAKDYVKDAQASNGATPNGGGCPCGKSPGECCGGGEGNSVTTKLFDREGFQPYDPTQELIFPPALLLKSEQPPATKRFKSARVQWSTPTSLEEVVQIKASDPQAKLIVGNTEVGIEMKIKHFDYPHLVNVANVPELQGMTVNEDGCILHGSITLSDLQHGIQDAIQSLPEWKTWNMKAILEALRWFAGHQVRNMACLAGNIATASPISDINPVLVAADATITVASSKGTRDILASDFFVGYRKTAMQPEEVIVSVYLPHTKENQFSWALKQARRREDDIALVNTCMNVCLEDGKVSHIRLAYGGMAATTTRARGAEAALLGKEWNASLVDTACSYILEDLPVLDSTPGGMAKFRMSLAISFFFKFFVAASQVLAPAALQDDVHPSSALDDRVKPPTKALQTFDEAVASGDGVVGKPVRHRAAPQQASGEARYTDDIPAYHNELYAGLVLSKHAHARILGVDPSAALSMPGVIDYVSASDVKGSNIIGDIVQDEECFATEKTVHMGQVIGIILADTKDNADRAALAVKVEYEPLKPIITIEQAIEAESFFEALSPCVLGDVERELAESEHILEDEMRVGGQEHFYLETQA